MKEFAKNVHRACEAKVLAHRVSLSKEFTVATCRFHTDRETTLKTGFFYEGVIKEVKVGSARTDTGTSAAMLCHAHVYSFAKSI